MLSLSKALILLVVCIFAAHYVQRRSRRLPPGPLGFPVLGNLFDMPTSQEGERIAELGKRFGDVVYLKIFSTPVVLLNSARASIDLLDKRGSIYSDRPRHVMAADFSGMRDVIPITRFTAQFKSDRKLMNQALSTRAVAKWEPIIVDEVHAMLKRLSFSPDLFESHLRRMGGSLVMMTMYGHRVTSDNDRYLQVANDFMAASSYAITGRWVVDFLPFIRYIPGLAFRRQAEAWRQKVPEWVDNPFADFKAKMSPDSGNDSLCGTLLFPKDGGIVDPVTENRIKWIAMSGFGAGTDTMLVALLQFILAMVLNPEVQAKAQKELDTIVGTDRLPTFEDRTRLPYFECVYKESLRWGTPAPLTVPHRLMQADEYRGNTLPAGSMCISNIWGILHDEDMFPNPQRFYPERFQEQMGAERAKLMDPIAYVFGFGRRRCPGIHFANSALWYGMVSLLAVFKMLPANDEYGKPIPVVAEFSSGAIRYPKPFKCNISFRNDKVASLVM